MGLPSPQISVFQIESIPVINHRSQGFNFRYQFALL